MHECGSHMKPPQGKAEAVLPNSGQAATVDVGVQPPLINCRFDLCLHALRASLGSQVSLGNQSKRAWETHLTGLLETSTVHNRVSARKANESYVPPA